MLENFAKIDVERAIDNEPERAVFTVLADIGDRTMEIRIDHRRHGDQQLPGQIGRVRHLHCLNYKPSIVVVVLAV